MSSSYIRWFKDIRLGDIPIVGGKNASLGEMYGELSGVVRVPNGFAVTAQAYWHTVQGVKEKLQEALSSLDKTRIDEFSIKAKRARDLVIEAGIPDDLWAEIRESYDALCREYGDETTDVAVRSSATAEDLPTASFAGQQETFLNIRGHTALKEACSKCFASLFTDRAISYRIDNGFDHFKVALHRGNEDGAL